MRVEDCFGNDQLRASLRIRKIPTASFEVLNVVSYTLGKEVTCLLWMSFQQGNLLLVWRTLSKALDGRNDKWCGHRQIVGTASGAIESAMETCKG